MKKEIRDRLLGLEDIIERLHHNSELMEYMSFNLHHKPFSLSNNLGLHWIWGQTMGNQILDFYKVMHKEEKFSFTKIINVARGLKCEVNYELLEKKTKALRDEYDKTNFERVRSKYLAHQDLSLTEERTDLITIDSLTEKIIDLFHTFSKEFKGRKVKFPNTIVNSFKKVFDEIDEYERVKAFLWVEEIKGHNVVKISQLAKSIKKKRTRTKHLGPLTIWRKQGDHKAKEIEGEE